VNNKGRRFREVILMFKYYKVYAESLEGDVGACYIEVGGDNSITRQVLVFKDKLYWSTPEAHADERHMFTDQPEIDEEHDDLSPGISLRFGKRPRKMSVKFTDGDVIEGAGGGVHLVRLFALVKER